LREEKERRAEETNLMFDGSRPSSAGEQREYKRNTRGENGKNRD